MTSSYPPVSHLAAVLHAWPDALRAERTAVELREAAGVAAKELAAGRTDLIDRFLAEVRSPAPTLRWAPDDADLAAPELRFLNRYWRDRRRDGELPLASDIDALDLAPVLGFVMLMEPSDCATDFRYRVYGTRIVQYSNVEMTGKCVWDIPAPLVAAYFVATYRAVVVRRQPLFAHHRTHHDIQVAQWDRLILPFADAHGTVSRLLVGNIPNVRPLRAAP